MNEIKIKVAGMNCNHCKINVETGLKRVPGVETAVADIIHGEVKITGNSVELDQVRSAIEDLGYIFDGEVK